MKSSRSYFHPSLTACVRRCSRFTPFVPQAQTCGMGIGIMIAFAPFALERAAALDRTWIGGNADWIDSGSTTNWNPADEPDSDDTAIFNTPNTVNLGSDHTTASGEVSGLTMSGGISLNTNDWDLTVDGLVQLTGAGTDLEIGGSASTVSADSATISSSASIILNGGVLGIVEETLFGTLDINATGNLTGVGTFNFNDGGLGAATILLSNDGTISATRPGLILGSPLAGTLSINAPGDVTNARLDLDGAGVSALLRVSRNQTLDINVQLFDNYSDDIDLFHNATLDMANAWSIDGNATIDVDNGFVDNGGFFDIPASTSFISGGAFTQLAGTTITVVDGDGALQFNAPFTMTGGNLVNNGEVIFNADATIAAGANFTMPTTTSSLTVNAGVEVNVDQLNFNPDGGGLTTNVMTIGSLGILDLDLGVGADTGFGNLLNLNGGELDVTTDTDTWSITGTINVGASTGTSQLNGEALTLSSVPVTVGASSTLDVNASSTWASTASAAVGAGSTLRIDGAGSVLSGASFTGAGTMVVGSTNTVSASTTVATGTFDWDGTGVGSAHTINDGVVFTITSPIFDSDGDMDDPIILGGSGAGITVSGPVSWEMKGTLTSNTIATGVATIAGTSRMELTTATGILNVNGSTTISAPVTFGSLSTTNIAAATTLTVTGNAIYDGGTITGLGTYNPPSGNNNTVSSNSTISCTNIDLDRGNWTVEPGATLTLNVSDYDNTSTDLFESVITLNSGSASVTTDNPTFIADEVLNFNNTTGIIPTWSGEPLDIGNDTGTLDADLNVGGTGSSQISTPVTFQSDADVNVALGSTLILASTATFNSVNVLENAQFTGTGTLVTGSTVNFNETTTLGFTGGTVDLDGLVGDTTANTINVDAPVVINAAAIDSFGNNANLLGFANTIDINSLVGTGILTVNLDNPASEWTLNSSGVMSLVNDNFPATLLAGSDVNLNGTVNVTGDVRTDARVDIGPTAVVNILTAAEQFRLGGGSLSDPNTINGGTINGPGLLGADSGSALTGSGTIAANADIDFDGSSDLLADNGTFTINSTIIDVRNIGTADADGILNVTTAWIPPAGSTVLMQGGQLQGLGVTLDNANGMTGHGDVNAPIINNTVIHANIAGQTLKLNNSLNEWDGTDVPEDGILRASNGGTLECNDNLTFTFDGTINAFSLGTVASNGFAFTLSPASTVNLSSGGTYRSTNSTDIQGAVNVGAGADSTIEVQINRFLDFEATSVTNLVGDLRLVSNNGIIRAGATFGGAGALKIPAGSIVSPDNAANINVLVDNSGWLRPAGSGVGRLDVKDFQQSATGDLDIDLNGTALANYDRLIVSGTAQVGGDLLLDIGGGYVPALNDTFNVLAATGGVLGSFNLVQPVGMPAGLAFEVTYPGNLVQLKVVASSPFDTWINSFVSLINPADKTKGANPDGDELSNLGEFGLDGNPASGISSGKIVGKIAPVGGVNAMTLTFPVRNGAILDVGDPLGGELVLKQVADGLTYRIQATDDFVSFPLTVTEVTGLDAAAIQSGLPGVSVGWTYRTFRSPGGVAGDPVEFMRVVVSP